MKEKELRIYCPNCGDTSYGFNSSGMYSHQCRICGSIIDLQSVLTKYGYIKEVSDVYNDLYDYE
jgi:hypothetical protein